MSVLLERLDKIASELESQGLIREAEDLDVISNTLEAFEKEAWTATSSPIYMKFFAPALKAAKAGAPDVALKSLKMGDGMKRALVGDRMTIPEFRFFSGLWDQAVASLSSGDAAKAAESLEKAEKFFPTMEQMINAETPGYNPGGQQPAAPAQRPGVPPGGFVAPAKGVDPSKAPATRAPQVPPARALR